MSIVFSMRKAGKRISIAWPLVMSSTVLLACRGQQYSFQTFTFPQGVSVDETSWLYRGAVYVITDASGSMFRRSDKRVEVFVSDTSEHDTLRETFDFFGVSQLKADISWRDVNELKIVIIEYGSAAVDDAYAQSVARSGERIVGTYVYHLEPEGKKGILMRDRS